MAFIHQSRDAMLRLSHSALDLCQLVLTPLEDVFCSVRRLGIRSHDPILGGAVMTPPAMHCCRNR